MSKDRKTGRGRGARTSAEEFSDHAEPAPLQLGPRGREFVGLVVVGVALFLLLSLATFDRSQLDAGIPRGALRNVGGVVGYHLANGLTWLLGAGAWAVCASAAFAGFAVFVGRRLERGALKIAGLLVFVIMIDILLAGPRGDADPSRLFPYGPGGTVAAVISPRLTHAFGGSGRLLVVLFGALCSLLLATEWLLSALLIRAGERIEGTARRVGSLRPRMAWAGSGAAVLPAPEEAQEEPEPEPAPARRRRRAARSAETEIAAAETALESPVPEPVEHEEESEAVTEAVAADATSEGVEPEPAPDADADADAEEGAGAEGAPGTANRRLRIERTVRKRRRPKPRVRHPELPFDEPWNYPPLELFPEPPEPESDGGDQVIQQNMQAIEQRLASFKLDARVVAASVGPAVTQYEVALGEGIKLSKVTSFEADLAAALRALNVRVVAPIPGKDTVGVEVPNKTRQMVYMRELLADFGLAEDKAIPLFLGKDVAGEAIVEDLARMPHLLIAGTTGSGKSVCINSILLSVLMTRTPRQVRLVLIDPKMVELQVFRKVPHLACDVVTNMKRAPQVLNWAVEEMERRYTVLSGVGTNHIKTFNKLGKEEIERRLQRPIEPTEAHLPYIVVVIDELADLMNTAAKEVEESIQRLAQKSRAVGIHVILATQRPSTDVITGVIKANLPCQIAFKVNRKIDSRVILDSNGAEKLLGYGDMLFVSPSAGQTLRAQGAFVSEEETHGVCDWLEKNGPNQSFIQALVQSETAKRRGPAERDDLYEKSVEIILGQQRGSATLIQRALAVGYTRATRLLEMMEEDGLVGPFCGSKSREVLMTLEEWHERERALAEELAEADGEEFEELDDEDVGDEESVDEGSEHDDSADADAEADDAEDSADSEGEEEDEDSEEDAGDEEDEAEDDDEAEADDDER
ncbi:MAG: DNA translocase FtsK 4TM domain-containing protein [Planctomycetota bacterium]